MENNEGNIVMFPKLKSSLEKKGLQAWKEKRYEDAVKSFEPLLEYGVANQDVVTGLLMSWIELGQFDEAEELCRQKMKEEVEQYYHYLHIYITILFQSNRYQEIVDLLDEVFEMEDIPHQSRTQLWQMYEVSRKLLDEHQKETGNKLINDFLEKLESGDINGQWATVLRLKSQSPEPFLETCTETLKSEAVHPIIKTALIEWLRDYEVTGSVSVHKFGQFFKIHPDQLNQMHSDYILKQIQMRLSGIEQSNPTMYEMLNRLLTHYCYVRYPLYPDENEVPAIVEALKRLGHEYLQLPYKENDALEEVERYKEEIELCEQHYLMIVGDD
ncbi:tetratricopeptide repeat protein [Halobacillus yeomjeoni]|uniref:tetratricopeptide repeat protein n=1 Tax=Halobacillus yeomjeoni TaxID=311194 RepID=UPI001CD72D6E|nr:tetratricopeptide repeat protein [Halobacillus yeomjeoni]MCA0982569.1 tetratricopeptide repeat protein [Halobacillus yeomjeoni]